MCPFLPPSVHPEGPLCVLMLKERNLWVCEALWFECVCVYERDQERMCVLYLCVSLLMSFTMEKTGKSREVGKNEFSPSVLICIQCAIILIRYLYVSLRHSNTQRHTPGRCTCYHLIAMQEHLTLT